MSTAFDELWQQRYAGISVAPPTATDNPVIETLLSHRSVRRYLDRPLPEQTLPTLLAWLPKVP